MPKKRAITQDARAKVLLKLKAYQQEHPDGGTITTLRHLLGWKEKDTKKIVDDLVETAMIYGDYLSPWIRTHRRKDSKVLAPYLLKVSPWGDEFLEHWEELTKLATATDHYYSEAC
jgi:hypothetical protein